MTDLTSLIDTYLSAWTEPDPDRRMALIEATWSRHGQIIDPPFEAEGHAEINEMFAALQAQYPGHRFRRTSRVDLHHGVFRCSWELLAPDGKAVLAGLDVGDLAEDGRLTRVTGFFGDLTSDAA